MFGDERALMVSMKNTTETRSMLSEIARLRAMTVAELQIRWRELYGEESRSRNRDFLWRRLAWRLQELAHGGLSDRAKSRIADLAPAGFMRAVTPTSLGTVVTVAESPDPAPVRRIRDPRLPSAGTVLTRQYHGREIRVLTLEDSGFEWDGRRFGSLSEVARAVTGARWNGRLFFGLRERTRRK